MIGPLWGVRKASWASRPAVIGACVLLGGATRSGYASDAVAQLFAVPLLLWAVWRLWDRAHLAAPALIFCCALVCLPLLQLIPLPPAIWTGLPFRDLVAEGLTLAGQEMGWRPLSLTPHATWLSLLSLVPPLAVFLATLLLSSEDRRAVALLLLGLGVVSSFLGLLQVAQGPGGTDLGFGLGTPGEATGFFANRNHFAAFLYSLMLVAAAFAIHSTNSRLLGATASKDTRALLAVVLSFTVLVILLAGEIMSRSRAGLGLTIVALFGIAALATSEDRGGTGLGSKRLIGGAVVLVLLFASQFALFRVMERFAADPLADARITFAQITWEAANAFMPWGSGLGSFVPVYQFFEKPEGALLDTYANRAHNDVLEVWLETGVVGLVLMALFALWLMVRFWQVWRSSPADVSSLDPLLARAAAVVLVLLLAHSLVDYPLRTTAMMALFAFSCGLLFAPIGAETNKPPQGGPESQERERVEAVRRTDMPRRMPDLAWPEPPEPVRPKTPLDASARPRDHRPASSFGPVATGSERGGERERTPGPTSPAARWDWPDETRSSKPRPPDPAPMSPVPRKDRSWRDLGASTNVGGRHRLAGSVADAR